MSGAPATGLRALRWSGTTPVQRAVSALLWHAVPTVAVFTAAALVLGLLALVGVFGAGAPGGGTSGVVVLATIAGAFVLLAWLGAARRQVPVLVAHGVTRRAVGRALLIAAPASAVALTVVMLVAAGVEVAVQGGASAPQGHAGVWALQLLAAYTGLALLGALAGVLLYRWSGGRPGLLSGAAGAIAVLALLLGVPSILLGLAEAITPTNAWTAFALLAAGGVPLALEGLALRRPPG